MGKYIGDANVVSFFYESGTYASTSGNAQWIGEVQNHTPDENMNVQAVRYVGGGDRNVNQFVDGPADYTGTFTYYPQDWKFFMFALGSNVDGGSPSPYSHTISETNSTDGNAFTSGTTNPFISFTLEDAHQFNPTGLNFIRTIKGCIVDTLTISASQGDFVNVTVDYRAQDVTYSSGAATSVTAATTRPFMWRDVQLQIPSGTNLDELRDFSLSIAQNLDAPHYLNGSRVISTPVPLNRDHELTITIDSTSEWNKTLYDQYFMGGSTFNAMLIIDASTGSRDAFVTMSGCKIIDMESPTAMEGIDEQTITIRPQSVSALVNDTIEKYNPW